MNSAAIINIGHDSLRPYKLVVVPADYVMDPASAKALRDYVSSGGTVLMTAFSAKVDQHGLSFDTPLPGLLSDVFGLKTNAFYDTASPLQFDLEGRSVNSNVTRYEVLNPSTATVVSQFKNVPARVPALTVNHFGKGQAFYLATESKASAIGPVLDYLYTVAGVQPGPKTPVGVYARVIDGRTLYVNKTGDEKQIPILGTKTGLIGHRVYDSVLTLAPQDAELLQ